MSTQQGSTLFEILISLVFIAILLTGLDALETSNLRAMQASYYSLVAVQQANNLIEKLKLLKHDLSLNDLKNWNEQNQIVLPQGRGEIHGMYPSYELKIMWGRKNSCKENKMAMNGCMKINFNV